LEYLPGNKVRISQPQLERGLYEQVNDILVRILGKWKGGKIAAHVFPHDPKPLIGAILRSNELPPKNPYAFFPTPRIVVDVMLDELTERKQLYEEYDDYNPTPIRVLEPSAGMGGIADAVKELLLEHDTLDCVELAPIQTAMLRTKGYTVYEQDFTTFNAEPYDYILMNPPFSVETDSTAYITHIYHAFSLLKENGTLYAVTPIGWENNSAAKFRAFREFVGLYGLFAEKFPQKTFKESGTDIATVVLKVRKETDNSDHHTWLAGLYIDNDRKLVNAAKKCSNVQEFTIFLYDTLWKEIYKFNDFLHVGSVDTERLYKQILTY
jgi:hypothetical protein